jgi:hypothetical protein
VTGGVVPVAEVVAAAVETGTVVGALAVERPPFNAELTIRTRIVIPTRKAAGAA